MLNVQCSMKEPPSNPLLSSLPSDYAHPKRTTAVDFPLYRRLPKTEKPSSNEILNAFLSYVEEKNLVPYTTQEEAILELLEDHNVILNTPTGSGKSLAATFLHFQSLARGLRSVYTCPIKAL